MLDNRPLSHRIKSLADQASARAEGARKRKQSLQDITNAEREAAWLNEAVVLLAKFEAYQAAFERAKTGSLGRDGVDPDE